MEKNSFTIIGEDGVEKSYDVLFTFDNDETKKSYIVYTDNSLDSNGKVQVYASIYDPENPHSDLKEIKTDKEWKVIETILQSIEEEVQKANEEYGGKL